MSEAAVDLELTQGINSALPLAVVPFGGNAQSTELLDIAAIVNSDLQNSGRFRLIDQAKMLEKPQSIDQVHAKLWQGLAVDNIAIGSVKASNDGKYQVNVQLLDVYGKKNITNAKPTILLEKQFIVPSQGMRKLAHHISDLIYEKLTGQRGIFSTHIAYVVVEKKHNIPSRYKLEVSDVDGFDPKTLLVSQEPIMSPAWSPEGSKIAYVSFEKNHPGIYVQEIASGQRRLVTDYPGINGAPSWSPDGTKLAFVLSKGGAPNVYTLDISSNSLVQRTTGNGSIDTEPSWSPDGKSIIFTSSRSGGPQIYRVDLATGAISRMTFDGNYNASGSFTPDGKSIILLHQQAGSYNIALQNLQTGKIDILTETGRDQSPSIAPNGSMVVFATTAGSKQVLGMVSIDSHVAFRLPPREGDVREPDWSPF
jgi:TolB protein